MIDWSNTTLKFTSGIGALCTTALLAEVSANALPFPIVLVLAMVPLVTFLFVHPGELPAKVVRMAQMAASIWYLALGVILSILFFANGRMVVGWPIYFVGLAIGSIPCLIILWSIISLPPAPPT